MGERGGKESGWRGLHMHGLSPYKWARRGVAARQRARTFCALPEIPCTPCTLLHAEVALALSHPPRTPLRAGLCFALRVECTMRAGGPLPLRRRTSAARGPTGGRVCSEAGGAPRGPPAPSHPRDSSAPRHALTLNRPARSPPRSMLAGLPGAAPRRDAQPRGWQHD